LTSDACFRSEDAPDWWICWDFGHMRVRPTNYTMRASGIRSWLLEGSVDNRSWKWLHWESDNSDFRNLDYTASFDTNEAECRYIRLRPTGLGHDGSNQMTVISVEFFGGFLPAERAHTWIH
jgi:hypothetical protein